MSNDQISRVIPITDYRGRPMLPEDQRFEPLPGSVIMTEGLHGTAWQRFFRDGMWYAMGRAKPQAWEELILKRNVYLIYEARQRDDQRVTPSSVALRKAGA